MEGKWFADSCDGAIQHGRQLYVNKHFKIVGADIPDELLTRLYRQENLDGFGPATYVDPEYLGAIMVIFEFERDDG